MRGATLNAITVTVSKEFQSTRPMRGATKNDPVPYFYIDISIHAPHAGRDRQPSAGGR